MSVHEHSDDLPIGRPIRSYVGVIRIPKGIPFGTVPVTTPFDPELAKTETNIAARTLRLHLKRCDDDVVATEIAFILAELAQAFAAKSLALNCDKV